jgi:hypothetical protein
MQSTSTNEQNGFKSPRKMSINLHTINTKVNARTRRIRQAHIHVTHLYRQIEYLTKLQNKTNKTHQQC